MATWFGFDSATQLGAWDADKMDARIAAFPLSNPARMAFNEASDLLVSAGYSVSALDDTTVYPFAESAMFSYAASLWLQTWFDNLNYVASETGRDSAPDSVKRRIRSLQQQCVNHWSKIEITPAWANSPDFYSVEIIKS